MGWIITYSALNGLNGIDPDRVSRQFLGPDTYLICSSGTPNPLPAGWNQTKVVSVKDVTQIDTLVSGVPGGVDGVILDIESWADTPDDQKSDLATVIETYSTGYDYCQAHGLLLIATPAIDLIPLIDPSGTGPFYTRWINLDVYTQLMPYCDVMEIQAQGTQNTLSQYTSFVNAAIDQIGVVDPTMETIVGITTAPGGGTGTTTLAQMLDAAYSIRDVASTFWLNIPGSPSTADYDLALQFLDGLDPVVNTAAVGVLGDSLTYMNGLGSGWLQSALLAEGWASDKIQVSGVVGRATWGGGITPTSQSTIDTWRADGFDPYLWIVALGSNNQSATPTDAAGYIADLLSYIGPGRKVHWINLGFEVQAQCTPGGIYGGFNSALNSYVTDPATEPELIVHDWNDDATVRATHTPTIWKDGTHAGENADVSANGTARHMTNDGYQNYRVPFYVDTVSGDAPSAPEHTYSAPPPVLFRRGFNKGPSGALVLAADVSLDDTVVAASGTGVPTLILAPTSGGQADPVYSTDALRGLSAKWVLDNALTYKRYQYTFAAAVHAFSIRFLFKISVAPTGTLWIEQFLNGSTTGPGVVLATISGQPKVRLYNGAAAAGSAYDANIEMNTWYCVEHRGSGTTQFIRVTRMSDKAVLLDSAAASWSLSSIDRFYLGALNKGGTLDLYMDEPVLSTTATYFGLPRWVSIVQGGVEIPAVLSVVQSGVETPVDIDFVTA